jgi:hypothetical protein
MELEKKIQGRSPEKTNMVYGAPPVFTFVTRAKTKV